MNIVTPIPTNIVFTTANVNTEAARRDNVQRETIPQVGSNESSAAESGVGNESRAPSQTSQPVVYERPQIAQQQNANQSSQNASDSGLNQDNAEDQSAGRESAEDRQQEQQQQAEQSEIRDLQSRDREVRAHEQAHAAVGGQYAGSPQYEYETGPDGRRYAVSGEVSIEISEENTPEETVRKAQQVRAAALAPAEPSPQDLRVASEATKLATEARNQIASDKAEEAREAVEKVISVQQGTEQPGNLSDVIEPPELDDIVQGANTSGIPTRNLTQLEINDAAGSEEQRSAAIEQRVGVIENFYSRISGDPTPSLQLSA